MNCADPDFSKPLPGQVTHWTPRNPITLRPPPSPSADRWDKVSITTRCRPPQLPPVVFDKPMPRVF